MFISTNSEGKCFPGTRYIFTVLGFLAYFVIFSTRVSINVAIVAMVNRSHTTKESFSISLDECPLTDGMFSNYNLSQESSKVNEGEFLWTPQMQGIILGSYWYGYILTPILGGRLAETFSGKWVLGMGIFISSLLTILSPIAARHSSTTLIITRTLAGLTVGSAQPSLQSMLGRWLPDSERGLLSSIIYSGRDIGLIFGLAASGTLCETDLFGGWPSAFYVTGFIGCVWFVFWTIFVSNSPSTSIFITEGELKYITSDQTVNMKNKAPPIPWCKMLTSGPFWSIMFMNFGIDCYFLLCSIMLPTYLGNILHINIENNGLFSSLSFLPPLVIIYIVGFACDALINRNVVGRISARKICSAACGFGSALGLLGVCLAECDILLSIAFLTISKSFTGFMVSGYIVGIVELSPQYAGTITGILNTVVSLAGFLIPMFVGYLTEEEQTLKQWRIIFGMIILNMLVGTSLFVFFYTTKNQNWVAEEETSLNSQKKHSVPDSNECVTILKIKQINDNF